MNWSKKYLHYKAQFFSQHFSLSSSISQGCLYFYELLKLAELFGWTLQKILLYSKSQFLKVHDIILIQNLNVKIFKIFTGNFKIFEKSNDIFENQIFISFLY